MNIEILYFAGCPSFETLLPRVREIVAEHGGNPDEITLRTVETPEAAVAFGFLGSAYESTAAISIRPRASAMTSG